MRNPKPARLIAYDFETERIREGTPRPLYVTAYAKGLMHYASTVESLAHLRQILRNHFLTEELKGVKFVAWNGNRFDAYYVAAAMVGDPDFVIRPYLTQSHSLRGLQVLPAEKANEALATGWEFLDGMAMLGLEGVSLEKLLENFTPEHRKLTGVVDFEDGEDFDPANVNHRDYAMRDSVGLWHAMTNAQQILLTYFDEPLRVTMGATCIRIFQANMPADVYVHAVDDTCLQVLRDYVMRGGYCYLVRPYHGPVWKYDINQAYAAAMRESPLPCGRCYYWGSGIHPTAKVYIARVTARNPRNLVPFYYRTIDERTGKIKARFAVDFISETWLTSVEIEQLKAEGWGIEAFESYQWDASFDMGSYVGLLEYLRTTCEGGPSGPIGTMVKAVGNHSYGKTVEEVAPVKFLLSHEQPDGYQPYFDEENNEIEHVWFRVDENHRVKAHHHVQLGAFITASVRMKVRRAALLAPYSFIYADTDCVVFDSDQTSRLDIDPKRYGAWKVEESGRVYRMIAKKVYAEDVAPHEVPKKRSAKGLNVKRLKGADFIEWAEGSPPVQEQVQRQNFLIVMQGAEMFRRQVRRGTAVALKSAP